MRAGVWGEGGGGCGWNCAYGHRLSGSGVVELSRRGRGRGSFGNNSVFSNSLELLLTDTFRGGSIGYSRSWGRGPSVCVCVCVCVWLGRAAKGLPIFAKKAKEKRRGNPFLKQSNKKEKSVEYEAEKSRSKINITRGGVGWGGWDRQTAIFGCFAETRDANGAHAARSSACCYVYCCLFFFFFSLCRAVHVKADRRKGGGGGGRAVNTSEHRGGGHEPRATINNRCTPVFVWTDMDRSWKAKG